MTWLAQTPMCVVNAHLAMLGRLTAEERLAAAAASGAGKFMKPGPVRRQIAAWDASAHSRGDGSKGGSGVPAGAGIKVVKRG